MRALNLGRQQILEGFLVLKGYSCKLDMGAEEEWACHRQKKWHVECTECVVDKLLLEQTLKERCMKQS